MVTRALVLAGGGLAGIAWESGVLAGLRAGGFDTDHWDLVVGTSAGAFVGSRLTADGSPEVLFVAQSAEPFAADEAALQAIFGRTFGRVVGLARRPGLSWLGLALVIAVAITTLVRYAARRGIGQTATLVMTVRRLSSEPDRWPEMAACIGAVANTVPRRRTGACLAYWTRQLGEGQPWPETRLVTTAVDITTGARRTFDAASGATLVEAVAASTCLPGLLAPVAIDGHRYIDGGLSSAANADLAAGHGEVVVVSPFGAPSLEREVEGLRASGAAVRVILPSAAANAAMGGGIAVMDPARRATTAWAGYADGLAAAAAPPG